MVLNKSSSSGNCLGEDGIELLREVLEAKGCIDALGSLSDDEGLESDEEEEEGGGESGEEEEEEGTEGEVSTDERLRAEGTAITPERPSPGSMSGPSQQESRTVRISELLNRLVFVVGYFDYQLRQCLLNLLSPLKNLDSKIATFFTSTKNCVLWFAVLLCSECYCAKQFVGNALFNHYCCRGIEGKA